MKKLSKTLLDFRTRIVDIFNDISEEDELDYMANTLEDIIGEELRIRVNDIRYFGEDE